MSKMRHGFYVLLILLCIHAPAAAQARAPGGAWARRTPVTINNPNDTDLDNYPVRLTVETASPSALRFTEADGLRYLPHWLQSYVGGYATVWVRVGHLPKGASTIYFYDGNPGAEDLSSGARTFAFFDDFDRPGPGYFPLSPPTVIATKDQPWETQAPHTLSVVERNSGGFRYWGYYGLADCGGIGLMRSNDLEHWQKDSAPLFNRDGERWPSVSEAGGLLTMVYDRDHCGTSHIVMRTSRDGLNFSDMKVLVAQEPGVRNQNPNLFWNPADRRYYLYWYRGGEAQGRWQIRARSASTPAGLADPLSEKLLLDEPYTLAAPDMFERDGVYYLSTEINDNAWKTVIYAGPSALGPFSRLPGAVVLSDNEACWFQHVFEGRLHGFYCKDTRGDGQGWVLQHRSGDLTRRSVTRALDPTFWTILRGDWQIAPASGGRNLLTGSAGAQAQMVIPVGRNRCAEARGEDGSPLSLQISDGHARLAGAVRYATVWVRACAPVDPNVSIGRAQSRLNPQTGWFATGNSLDTPVGGASIASLFAGVLAIFGSFLLLLAGIWVGSRSPGR